VRYISLLLACILFGLLSYGQANQCGDGAHWVRAHHRRAYYRGDGTFVKATEVSAHCQNNQQSYGMWREKLKDGFPKRWPHHSEKSTKWTEEEIERVLEALDGIPKELLSGTINAIYRLKKSDQFPNPATWGSGVIALYDTAFNENRNLARVLAHEFSHEKYDDFSDQERQDYRRETGWKRYKLPDGREVDVPRLFGYVEEDGKLFPSEDFANNVEYFLFDPGKLKEETPKAYNWIQKHFGDKFKVEVTRNAK